MENNNTQKTLKLPMIALRGLVIFPDTAANLEIARKKSILALNNVEKSGDRYVFLAPQLDSTVSDPLPSQICSIGTVAKVKSIMKLQGDNVKLLVDGLYRAEIISYSENMEFFEVKVNVKEEQEIDPTYLEGAIRIVKKQVAEFSKLDKKLPEELIVNLISEKNPLKLISNLATALVKSLEDRLEIIRIDSAKDRLNFLISAVNKEIDIMKVEHSIQSTVRNNIDKSQKEYYLREQMKAISDELGDGVDEIEGYKKKIDALGIKNNEILEKLDKELARLKRMSSNSPDSAIIRTYLDWICDLPWKKTTKENTDFNKSRQILDADHYGLEKVKERILEFLAVHVLTKKLGGTILCLVGPPGVGKTSIASSIARALNMNYVRMSLGGIRDESEIRGHRRTYIGAMPGRIIYNMRNSNSVNPLFLLDEIDKMSSDFRGDPASALLEVLDPSINSTFRDNFLEVPYDLSKVFFIATANSLDTVPEPLLDRMEVIELNGYTDEEKLEIAKRYLVKKCQKANGLSKNKIEFTDNAILDIITHYTAESGVRNLEKEISNIFRKIAVKSMACKEYLNSSIFIDKNVEEFLGIHKYEKDIKRDFAEVGACQGLAWTRVGGTTLTVEVSLMKGTGNIILTGQLGDVMKESARTALSYIQSNAKEFNIDEEIFSQKDVHIHVPAGATPKDGPSAGITMTTAIYSAFTNKKVRSDIAMTGEVTLRGKVLPIGGLKEKALASYRIGITEIIIPKDNEKNLCDIPSEILEKINFTCVEDVKEVLARAIVE